MNINKTMEISTTWLVFILALTNIILFQFPLFSFSIDNLDITTISGIQTLLLVSFIVFSFTAIAFFILFMVSRWVALPIIIIIFCLNATALYFMTTYQVVFDRTMMENIFNTRIIESNDYFHPKLFIYIFLLGLIPTWLIIKLQIKKVNRFKLLLHAVLTLLFCLLMIYLNSSSSLWIDKNASKLGSRILPWSYFINTVKHQRKKHTTPTIRKLLPNFNLTDRKKSVVVLVIGETARAQNFSLYGYERETNPSLNKESIVTMNDATACSTYTTASISCMLSHTDSKMDTYETLPTYLSRQRVDVIWNSNNWGEPTISVNTYNDKVSLRKTCDTGNCDYDEVLLTGLKQRIENSKRKKILVILHTAGSHGPSYHTKYPPAFEKFKSVCKSVALDQCTQQELVNAYDNSLLYTDYFLSQLITLLKKIPETPISMMYVSDHGESLGEYGLYLHGTPFAVAPDFQKKIPFLLWMSSTFMSNRDISISDFKQRPRHSHRNIFHSIMGALSLKSSVYEKEYDIFWQSSQ